MPYQDRTSQQTLVMNRENILPLFRSKLSYNELSETLRQIDETELFHGLFSIAVDSPYQNPRLPVYDAANLLFELNPKCQMNCAEAIRAMLNEWDISLEEVPFYLHGQMGMPAIQKAIGQLQTQSLSHSQLVRLDTVRYWTEIAEQEDFEILRQKIIERWRES